MTADARETPPTSGGPDVLRANAIRKAFRHDASITHVLNGATFSLHRGQRLYLTGPNGSGKSVLAQCVCGILPFDGGQIAVNQDLLASGDRRSAMRYGIDYIPQHPPAPNGLSAWDFLALRESQTLWFNKQRLRSELSDRAKTTQLPIPPSLSRDLSTLGRFELITLYVLRAARSELSFLCLDEPTAGLDSSEAAQLKRAIARLQRRRVGVIVIAHPEQFDSLAAHEDDGLTHVLSLRDGLLQSSRALRVPQYDFLGTATRAAPPESWTAALRSGSEGEQPVLLTPGTITTVVGGNSRDFERFAYGVTHSTRGLRLVNAPPYRRSITVGVLPFGARDSELASSLTALENSLIHRWYEPPIRSWKFFISARSAEEQVFKPIVSAVSLVPSTPSFKVRDMSGGNRQRLVLGRLLTQHIDLLIACDLCRGLDDAGVRQVSRIIEEQAAAGLAVLLLTTVPGSAESRLADHTFALSSNGALVPVTNAC